MLRLCLTRCLAGVPALLLVTVLVFAVIRLIPGDPARILAGDMATEETVAELRQRWQLDRPLPVQYAAYLGRLARGDLGRSTATSLPVAGELAERFGRTLLLAAAAILVAATLGVLLGILSATRRGSGLDVVATVLALAGVSTPIFWSGLPDPAVLGAAPLAARRRDRRALAPRPARGQPRPLRGRGDRPPDPLQHAR